mmetsp:Transcript_17733/g.30731  ORF Transcript_17733/g.30731 Transcript_17733/m.30731 type:complete len:219 (-) Transcript_17733:1011-1667(-)
MIRPFQMLLTKPGGKLHHRIGHQGCTTEGICDVAGVVEDQRKGTGDIADGGHCGLRHILHCSALVAVLQRSIGQARMQHIFHSLQQRLCYTFVWTNGMVLASGHCGQLLNGRTISCSGVKVECEQPRGVCVIFGHSNHLVMIVNSAVRNQQQLPTIAPSDRNGICSLQCSIHIGAPHVGLHFVDEAAAPQKVIRGELQTAGLIQQFARITELEEVKPH